MGIYSPENDFHLDVELNNPNELLESYIYDDLSRLPESKRKEFAVSEEANVMLEKGIIGRRTLVKLSKSDDIERRIGMAAIQMAKEKNDPIYDQLIKNRVKERELLGKINSKYANSAIRIAKASQKEYLKNMPKGYSAAVTK